MLVNRFDVSEIGKPTRTPQGFLRVPAFLTRAGIFEYRRADGSIQRELRLPDEVFKADSLASLSAAPVTELHPTEMVSPKNVRNLRVGHVGEAVKRDGDKVSAHVTVEDEAVITKVDRGELREISCGYQCRLDATPGVYNGERYDAIQRDIVYNHAALGPRNWGRAGSDVALRLDSGDAMLASAIAFQDAPVRRNDSNEDLHMDMVTIRIDGLDVSVPKQWAQVVEKGLKERDEKLDALTKERDGLQAKLDSATKELGDTKAKLTEATDTKRIDALISERATLITTARKVLGDEHKFDGQTTRQIHEAVLVKLDDKLDLKGKSDEYVSARFDAETSRLPADQQTGERHDSLSAARRATTIVPKSGPVTREDAKPYVPAWKKPLSATKD